MNYDILHFFSQHLTTVAINIIVFLFFGNIYHKKYDDKAVYILTFIVWTGVMFWVNSYNIGVFNLLFFFISSELICICLFDTSFHKSWLYNVMLLLLMFFNDIVAYTLWSVTLGMSFDSIWSDSRLLFLSDIINVLMSLIEYRLLTLKLDKGDLKAIKAQETVFLFFMTIIECYILYSLSIQIKDNDGGWITLVVLSTFLIFNIYIMYIIRKVADLYKYKYDVELITRQNNMQFEHYKEMEQTYREARHIIHDMKQHLTVMKDLNSSESCEYSSTLENRLESLFGGFQCSNQILSIIMGRKYKDAESKDIQVKMDVEDIDLDFMEDPDITGIFANLWDNAIEACENIEPKKRKIFFVMNKVNGFIIVNMENTYNSDEYNKMRENSLNTTKENHMGVGLSVIKKTVEKYDGLFNVIPNEKKFVVEITMPISQ